MNVTQIFCDADDFCQGFIPNWEKTQLEAEEKAKTRTIVFQINNFHATTASITQ
jgi:hypothetical protein